VAHVAGVGDGPLKGLLRAHGEADDGLEMAEVELLSEELMNGFDVVADSGDGEPGTVEGLRRI
jgi:hypothetical protein